jgi:hypothetical protein
MPLLNYTTTVSAHKTAAEVQRLLISGGARAVLAEYEAEEITALSFVVATPLGQRSYRLPVNADKVLAVLTAEGVEARYRTEDQAHRVAWRIVKDWLEAQLAIIRSEMVTFDQVMLPYMHTDPSRSTTVYQLYTESGMGELEAAQS